jgi:hypothetical protein
MFAGPWLADVELSDDQEATAAVFDEVAVGL